MCQLSDCNESVFTSERVQSLLIYFCFNFCILQHVENDLHCRRVGVLSNDSVAFVNMHPSSRDPQVCSLSLPELVYLPAIHFSGCHMNSQIRSQCFRCELFMASDNKTNSSVDEIFMTLALRLLLAGPTRQNMLFVKTFVL